MSRLVGFAVLCVLLTGPFTLSHARQEAPPAHARRLLTLLNTDKFEEVSAEFNARMAAAMTTEQLRGTWTTIRAQLGSVTTIIDEQITEVPGVTAVILGVQFERAAMNVRIAFNPDGKIAGLGVTRRDVPAPPAVPSAASRFTEESITVGSGEWALPGTLTIPTGPISAAVVLVQGSGPHDRDSTIGPNKPFRDLAWGLAERGVAVVRYEKRTRQYASKLGTVSGFTVKEETIDDAVAAVALLRTRSGIDARKVFVLGHSLGGTLAPRIATTDPSIAGIVIMAGATRSLFDAVRDQVRYLAAQNPSAPPVDVEQAVATLRRAAPESYWTDLDAYRPAAAAAALTKPILILHAERDYQVTREDLQGWHATLYGRANVTFETYPTLNHLFLPGEGPSTPAEYLRPDRIPAAVLDDIAAWIRAHSS